MSMAASIELPVPFPAHRLVKYFAELPTAPKLDGRTVKYPTREAIASEMPESIIKREGRGFPGPPEHLFWSKKAGLARTALMDLYSAEHGIFCARELCAMRDKHKSGVDGRKRIWQAALALEIWYQRFIAPPLSNATG